MWFSDLTGFYEKQGSIYNNLTVKEGVLKSNINGREFYCGTLETPTLKELRDRVVKSGAKKGKLKLEAIQADVKALHLDEKNKKALFQVASQFNLLEMVNSTTTPEEGVDIYEYDHTQGPICAICTGAGTIYRNYFVPLDGQIGQSSTKQIDCLAKVGEALGNDNSALWRMRNGYALLKEEGIYAINRKLDGMSEDEVDKIRELLQIGLMWDTQVTLYGCTHRVSQAYCSALPISYVGFVTEIWKPFASLVLEASYEATICAGILNGDDRVYLTLVGGGVFGNELEWIISAIERACLKYTDYDLDVKIVNYRAISGEVFALVDRFDDKRGSE
jgi:hypothetical protein